MDTLDGRKGKRLAYRMVGNLRFFAFYIGNETLLLPQKDDMSIIYEPSEALGTLFAIELFGSYDEKGHPIQNSVRTLLLQYIQSLNNPALPAPSLPFTKLQIQQGQNWRAVLARFMSDLGLRNLQTLPLADYLDDYADGVIDYGSALEMLTAIFCNVLRLDEAYNVVNEDWARYRTSQYIRCLVDDSYQIEPPLKAWETKLWI